MCIRDSLQDVQRAYDTEYDLYVADQGKQDAAALFCVVSELSLIHI